MLPVAYCDQVQIQQVALNLIRNAIDAMMEIDCAHGNEVTCCAPGRVEGGVEVTVVDQGPGVAQEQERLIFSPFHTTKKEGMGMGLSICRSIIREHGGELELLQIMTMPGAECTVARSALCCPLGDDT